MNTIDNSPIEDLSPVGLVTVAELQHQLCD
jgi:hypothetical protein